MKFRHFIALVILGVLLPQSLYAMHIAEGFLPSSWCVIWVILLLPFIYLGIKKIKKLTAESGKVKVLLGVAGAFIFLLSALKLPSVTGSCSHMTGTGLGAILFGPAITSILGMIALLFQTLLLAHGGLTTLGANTFSMGVAGPLLTWLIYKGLNYTKLNNSIIVFSATFAGSLFTYCVTALQLALAFPAESGSIMDSFIKFISVFGVTQLPLSVIEGLVSVVVFNFIKNHNQQELITLNVLGRSKT